MKNRFSILLILGYLLLANTLFAFTRQDTLRGSNGPHRSWVDVQHYELRILIDTATHSLDGSCKITAKIITRPTDSLQLDLQELMFLDSVILDGQQLNFVKEGNVWWIKHPFSKNFTDSAIAQVFELTAYYHGKPPNAKNPPWDGGFIWTKDDEGKPWIAVACQGLGASSWWPCKDYQGDEPDNGMNLNIKVEEVKKVGAPNVRPMVVISNGKADTITLKDPVDGSFSYLTSFHVTNPINTYDATFYIGDYVGWTDTLMGEKGVLPLSFYCLRQHEEKARKQFSVVKQMLHCYEYWLGPYPFYEDGYKLVEAPYLGMEHQSAIAYGNGFKMGYRGMDRSGTGVGLLFDYIIVHESGHEWFGNSITAKDIADNWIHEGFTTYLETLFAECTFGKEKAFQFLEGERQNIDNDKPIIGKYGVQDDGSSDKYDKGASLIQTIRLVMSDDEKFRQLLRGLNQQFYHQTVTSSMIEAYINQKSGIDFTPIFNQYLRTVTIPKLEYYLEKKRLFYRFTNVVDGFSLPIVFKTGKRATTVSVSSEWQDVKWKRGFGISVSDAFLIQKP